MPKTIHYSVFFNDKSHKKSDNYLANLFNNHVDTNNSDQICKVFDGCAEEFGRFSGGLFGKGIDKNCQLVLDEITPLLNKGDKVILNVYGAGQGGINALMLAMACSKIPPEALEINLALHDPAPGNLISTAFLDLFRISLANKIGDLSHCQPLKKVLALYTQEPQLAILARAPVFPLYPEDIDLTIDAIPGVYMESESASLATKESFISFARFYTFLKQCGTQFKPFTELTTFDMSPPSDAYNHHSVNDKIDFNNLDERLKVAYERINNDDSQKEKAFQRNTHSITGTVITTRPGEFSYFNRHHQQLVSGADTSAPLRVSVEPTKNILASFNRFTTQYPRVWRAIKWSLFVLACTATALLLATTPASGAVALLLVAAAGASIGLSLLTLWHTIVKPFIKSSVNSFFYPEYHEASFSTSSSYGLVTNLTTGQAPQPTAVQQEEPIHRQSPIHPSAPQVGSETAEMFSGSASPINGRF